MSKETFKKKLTKWRWNSPTQFFFIFCDIRIWVRAISGTIGALKKKSGFACYQKRDILHVGMWSQSRVHNTWFWFTYIISEYSKVKNFMLAHDNQGSNVSQPHYGKGFSGNVLRKYWKSRFNIFLSLFCLFSKSPLKTAYLCF